MHRRDREDRDERDWRERRGRYAGLDPDTPDRPQVKPVERPPVERRTHTRLGGWPGYRDAPEPEVTGDEREQGDDGS